MIRVLIVAWLDKLLDRLAPTPVPLNLASAARLADAEASRDVWEPVSLHDDYQPLGEVPDLPPKTAASSPPE